MNDASEWIVGGLLRATVSLSIAALLVALAVRVLRVRSPRAEQFAWLLVLAQGLLLARFSLAVPAHWLEASAPPPADSNTQIPVDLPPVAAAAPENLATDERRRSVPADAGTVTVEPTATMIRAPTIGEPQTFRLAWPAIGVAVWLAGMAAFGGIGVLRY